jgi:hypothetical protein
VTGVQTCALPIYDDRATLYGAMLELAAKAREDHDKLMLWKRRGKRAFDAEAEGNETP